jgi:hypothetical protein
VNSLHILFTVTYSGLCLLVFLEALMLRKILRETLWFKRLSTEISRADWKGLTVGTRVSKFTAEVLDTGETFHSSRLNGQPTILLFVSPNDAPSQFYSNLEVVIHALWHKTKGHIYLVCTGAETPCRHLVHDHCAKAFSTNRVRTILDRTGYIAGVFRIVGTPQAVELDEDARIRRYGRPEPIEGEMHETSGDASMVSNFG